MKGYLATVDIEGAHPNMPEYPIIEGDLLVPNDYSGDGSWTKEAPGLCIMGFVLTPEQVSTLREVEYSHYGLAYKIEGETA